jgi:hypothetical protein
MIALLHEAGVALYGTQWQSEIARALDVSSRSVRRWVAEDTTPEDLELKLKRLVDARIKELKRVRVQLASKA